MAISALQEAEVKRKAAAGIALTNPTAETQALYSANKGPTSAARQAEINRKASEGIALTNPNGAAQALYDAKQSAINAEVNRKADAGISLAGNSTGAISGYNQNLYDARVASNASFSEKPPEVNVSGSSATSSPPSSSINTMYDDRYAAELQALRKARETAQQGLNSIATGAQQTAYQNRNLASAQTQQSAQRLRTIMADQGLLSSGDNITANVGIQSAGQAAQNDINQIEGNTLRDVAERRGIINNNASLDEGALLKEVNAARIAALIEEGRYQDARELQIAGLTGQLGGQRTLAGQQFDRGIYENDRNFGYQVGRDQVGDDQWSKQFEENKSRYGEEFAYQKARDEIKDDQWKQQFDEDKRRYGLDYAIQKQQVRISQQNADRLSIGGSGEGGGSTPKPVNLNAAITNINKLYTRYDSSTGARTVTDTAAIKAYIDSMGLADDQKSQLYSYYGVSSGSGSGGNFWDAIKNAIGGVANATNSSGSVVSDDEISKYLK